MPSFLQRSAIKKLVATSKERCGVKHGLSSNSKSPILRLQSTEVHQRKEQFLDRTGGAISEIDQATLLPRQSRYCLLVSDEDGIVIESYAPEGLETEFQRRGLVPGGAWDERVAGTNGISLSMISRRVITVQGEDHFYNCFSGFACSSAPLTDAEDNLIGTITLVGSVKRRADEITLCEQVLRRASRQFQTRLFRNYHSEKLTARVMSRDPQIARNFETLVACDDRGIIVSSLPLWRDNFHAPEHQNLFGKHLSELQNLEISLRGPAAVAPRRRAPQDVRPLLPKRVSKNGQLGRLIGQGGGLSVLASRARRLATHRVPVLICGEPGVDTDEFARALLEELGLSSPTGLSLNAACFASGAELTEALGSLCFLRDYPVDNITPTLILLNVEKLTATSQQELENYLNADEREAHWGTKPLILFTAGATWKSLEADDTISRNLLYLMGQSVLELPPIRLRDREVALNDMIKFDLGRAIELSDQARDLLIAYDWPGNRREMRFVLREALICGNGQRINVTDLPDRLSQRSVVSRKKVTRVSLHDALDSADWNVAKAARILGKSRATINRWIASEGLQRPE